jgi:histidinol-phosphate aminotransferase
MQLTQLTFQAKLEPITASDYRSPAGNGVHEVREHGFMSQYWSKSVHQLTPYIPGEQPKADNLIKLNTNENPYPPSPKALAAMQNACAESLKLYPDPNSDALKQSIADYYGLKHNQVFVGNGSDEVLAHTFFALLKQDKPLLFPDISYSFYPVYCGLYDIDYKAVPLDDNFEINIQDYQQPNGGIIFPNPNAPTGIALKLDNIEALLKQNPDVVVVVDEAYIDFDGDFGSTSAVALIKQYPNLLVVQTLSKSRSLAGLRLGFAMGHPDLIAGLIRVKDSFNSYPIDSVAAAGASAAILDKAYFKSTCKRIVQTRESMTADLQNLGFNVLPSSANFVFAKHPKHSAAKLAESLREQSIIVRHFKSPRIDDFLRITVGTDAQCAQLIQALTTIISKT